MYAIADLDILRLIAYVLFHYFRQNLQSVCAEVGALSRAERRRRRDDEDATEREELLNAHVTVKQTDGTRMSF